MRLLVSIITFRQSLSLISLSCLLVLSGCLSLDPSPDPTRLYLLRVPTPDALEQTPVGGEVGIRSVRFSDYLNRPEIIVRKGTNEVSRLSIDRWGGDLGQQLAMEFTRWWSLYEPERQLFFPPWDHASVPTETLAWRVVRLEGVDLGDSKFQAVVELDWSWRDSAGTSRRFRQEWTADWDGANVSQLVLQLSELLGKGFAQMVESGYSAHSQSTE